MDSRETRRERRARKQRARMGELAEAILLLRRPVRIARNRLIAAVRAVGGGVRHHQGGVGVWGSRVLLGGARDRLLRALSRRSERDALDLLYVALVLAVAGELAAVLADKSMLVFLFFLATMFLCVVVWRWD